VHFLSTQPLPTRSAPNAQRCSIRGILVVPANEGLEPLRLWLLGHDGLEREIEVTGGTYRIDDLTPGAYRVELRAPRFVIARRVALCAGDHGTLDFTIS
jgi:hypothetical protein